MKLVYLTQNPKWTNDLLESGKEQILTYKKDFESELDAVLVIKKMKIRFLPFYYLRIIFGPAANYNNSKELEAVLIQLKKIAKEQGALYIEFNPYAWDLDLKEYESIAQKHGFNKAQNHVYKNSIIVDLNQTEDEIFGQFERRGQKAIRQSVTRGVIIQKVELNEDNFDKFYALYKNTCERTQFIPEQRNLLQKQLLFWGSNNNVFLFFATDEGQEPIGALLLFNNGEAVSTVYQGNNYDPEIINKRASNALYWESLKWSKNNGFKYYDFGGITVSESDNADEKKEGIQNFKAQFGGRVVSLPGNYMFVNRKLMNGIINFVMPLYSKLALRSAKTKAFGK